MVVGVLMMTVAVGVRVAVVFIAVGVRKPLLVISQQRSGDAVIAVVEHVLRRLRRQSHRSAQRPG